MAVEKKKIVSDARELQEELFNWIGKDSSSGRYSSTRDCSVTKVSNNSRKSKSGSRRTDYQYSIIFRNGHLNDYLGSYMQVAVLKNRLYFRLSNNGYKITTNGSKSTVRVRVPMIDASTEIEFFINKHYDIHYDPNLQVWYIDLEEATDIYDT